MRTWLNWTLTYAVLWREQVYLPVNVGPVIEVSMEKSLQSIAYVKQG